MQKKQGGLLPKPEFLLTKPFFDEDKQYYR